MIAGPAGRRRVSRRPCSAQAQARISRVHLKSARTAGSELSCAYAVGDAGRSATALCRPGAARRQKASRAAPIFDATYRERERQPRLPLPTLPRHHALAVRRHRRRIFLDRGPAAGARRSGRRRRHRRTAALADPPHRGRGSRTRLPDAEARNQAGDVVRRLPRRRASDLSRRRGADAIALYEQLYRQLRRRLLPLSRRIRRSRGDRRAPRDCVQQIGFDEDDALFPERQPRLSRLRSAAGIFHVSAQVPRLPPDRTSQRSCRGCAANRSISSSPSTKHDSRLAAAVRPDTFGLYTAPAINLFEKTSDRIPIKSNHPRIPRRAGPQPLSRIRAASRSRRLRAFPGGQDKVPVRPLYSASLDKTGGCGPRTFLHGPAPAAAAHRRGKDVRRSRPTTPAPTCSSRCWSRRN